VALLDDQIVGFAELDATGFLDYFYVTPDRQRQGVGNGFDDRSWFPRHATLGVPAITADVSITAKSFFLAHRFEVVESRMNIILGHPAPNFSMIRRLSEPVISQE
jgi:putative acetyltransferase